MLCCLTKSGVSDWCSQLVIVPCLILQCYVHSSKLVLLFNNYSRFHQFLATWRDITITTRVGVSKFKCECLDCKAELLDKKDSRDTTSQQYPGLFFLGITGLHFAYFCQQYGEGKAISTCFHLSSPLCCYLPYFFYLNDCIAEGLLVYSCLSAFA